MTVVAFQHDLRTETVKALTQLRRHGHVPQQHNNEMVQENTTLHAEFPKFTRLSCGKLLPKRVTNQELLNRQ